MLGAVRRRPPGIAIVMAAFLGSSAFVVPTLAPVAVCDDWIFARAVDDLVRGHGFAPPDLSAPTLVAQALWGSAFARVFGFSLGVVRVSTVAIAALGALALYGLSRELGVRRDLAAVATAAFLFYPLTHVLAHTFMTDVHFTAWMLVATYLYVRGYRREEPRVVAGAAVAASVAVLVRQQGALVPLAVGIWLVARHWRTPGLVTRRALAAGLLPAVTLIGYLYWSRVMHHVPTAQAITLAEVTGAGARGTLQLLWRLPFITVTTFGLAVFPMLLAIRPRRGLLSDPRWQPEVLAVYVTELVIAVGAAIHLAEGRFPPYGSQFFSRTGAGPADLLGQRAALWGTTASKILMVVAAAGAVAWIVGIIRMFRTKAGADDATDVASELDVRALVLVILLAQGVGALIPSFHFLEFGGPAYTLDRYLLPLLPLALALFAAALPPARLRLPIASVAVALLACVSVAATRDFLTEQRAVWRTADQLHAAGIPRTKIDAGPGWDGWYLSDGKWFGTASPTPHPPWWVDLYARATDSTYRVAYPGPTDDRVVRVVPYSSWLQQRPTALLVRDRRHAATTSP